MSEPLGIIGLGRIGFAAAKAWLKQGYQVFGYDSKPSAMTAFVDEGGQALQSPEEVTRHTDAIIVLVLNDDQVVEVVSGADGILRAAGFGKTVICMSTVNRETLQHIAVKCQEKNVALVDCPFTGGVARIASQDLTLIAAAPAEHLEKVRHLLEVIGRITYAGEQPGNGQAIKHCNQLLVGATHAATMEVITLARRIGLDPALVTAVTGSGIAGSDYFRMLSESVLTKKPSPGGLGQMCKDMAIVSNTLRRAGIHARVAQAAAEYFSAALKLGMADREGADLIEVVDQFAARDEDETKNI